MKSRDALWADSAALSLSQKDRSRVSAISWIDQSLGVLDDFLTERAVKASTIVVLLSDNGAAKGSVFEYAVRTLQMVRYPNGGIAPGTVVSERVSSLDLAPSLFTLIGASASYDTDGVSWASVATGAATSIGRTHLVVEMANDVAVIGATGSISSMKLVFQDQVKSNNLANSGVQSKYPSWGVESQLYDLSADSQEANNLASEAAYASALATLQAARSEHVAHVSQKPCCSVTMSLTITATPSTPPASLSPPPPFSSPLPPRHFPSPSPLPSLSPSPSTSGVRKILCLHGGGGSGSVFSAGIWHDRPGRQNIQPTMSL